MRRPSAALIALLLLFVAATPVVAAEGQLTWAVHISLAPTWFDPATVSPDGLTYDFILRSGVKFHNGETVTADDVKFSFDRYKGAGNKALKDKVRTVQVVDPLRVRFVLKETWPDFMTFYASPATGAGWVVPRKYVEKVGDEGFKKAPTRPLTRT
jgi:peptide/nickel transport system substrate-binding protein